MHACIALFFAGSFCLLTWDVILFATDTLYAGNRHIFIYSCSTQLIFFWNRSCEQASRASVSQGCEQSWFTLSCKVSVITTEIFHRWEFCQPKFWRICEKSSKKLNWRSIKLNFTIHSIEMSYSIRWVCRIQWWRFCQNPWICQTFSIVYENIQLLWEIKIHSTFNKDPHMQFPFHAFSIIFQWYLICLVVRYPIDLPLD